MQERSYESGNCVQKSCAILGVHPSCFSPTSVQFKSEINDALPRKRHQKLHLEFFTAYLLTKKANLTKLLLSVAYRLPLPKSRPQLYRSYTEFASLPRRPTVLAITCLVYLRHTSPSDARASSSQLPTTPFEPSRPAADATREVSGSNRLRTEISLGHKEVSL
jgi:hypothetical protein